MSRLHPPFLGRGAKNTAHVESAAPIRERLVVIAVAEDAQPVICGRFDQRAQHALDRRAGDGIAVKILAVTPQAKEVALTLAVVCVAAGFGAGLAHRRKERRLGCQGEAQRAVQQIGMPDCMTGVRGRRVSLAGSGRLLGGRRRVQPRPVVRGETDEVIGVAVDMDEAIGLSRRHRAVSELSKFPGLPDGAKDVAGL